MYILFLFILFCNSFLFSMDRIIQTINDSKGIVIIIVDNETNKVISIEGTANVQVNGEEITINKKEKECVLL